MLKNTANQSISALILDTAGAIVSTGTTTVYVTGDAGTQASGGTATYEGNGLWSFLPSQANTNYNEISFLFSSDATDAVKSNLTVYTTPAVVATAASIAALNDFDPTADTVATVTNITNTIDSNLISISDDTQAAINLEAMFDGTGYVHDTAPSSRDQVANLSTGSAAISTVADSGSITTGENPTGDYTDTFTRDGVYNSVDEVAASGNMEIEYQFNVGGNGVAVNIVMYGRLAGNGDILAVQAWNWTLNAGVGDWEQIGTVSSDTVDTEQQFNLNVGHTGTGVNAGEVKIRGFEGAGGLSNVTLYLDQVYVAYSIVAQSVGYAGGAIWLDKINGTAGTTDHINGTADNPVASWADVLILSASLGIKRVKAASGTNITLTSDTSGFEITGSGVTLVLGSQIISGAVFQDLIVSGIGLNGSVVPRFKECSIGNITLPPSNMDRCGYTGTLTVGSAGHFFIIDGFSQIPGIGSPVFNANSVGNVSVCWRRMGGGQSIIGLSATDTISAEATVGGTLTLNGTGGTVEMRGGWKGLDDQSAGAISITRSKTHADMASINESESSASNLRATTQGIIDDIVATIGTPTSCTLTNIPAVADVMIDAIIVVTSGLLTGERKAITANTAGKVVTFEAMSGTLAQGDIVVLV